MKKPPGELSMLPLACHALLLSPHNLTHFCCVKILLPFHYASVYAHLFFFQIASALLISDTPLGFFWGGVRDGLLTL